MTLDDLRACGLGRGARVDGDGRLGCAVGAPGVDVAAEPLGEAVAVRAVPDGARAEAGLWCFEALDGQVGEGVALGQGQGPRFDDRGAQPAGDRGRLGGDAANSRVGGSGADPDRVQGLHGADHGARVEARLRPVEYPVQLAGPPAGPRSQPVWGPSPPPVESGPLGRGRTRRQRPE